MSARSVFSPARFLKLLAADATNVARDPILPVAIGMSVTPTLLLALGRGSLDSAALGAFGVEEFSRFVVPFALVLPATLIGWVTGFLLLEDRDEGMLMALDTTPIGKTGFLAYRTTATGLLTAVLTLFGTVLLIPDAALGLHLLLAVLIGIESVASAVILPAIARNKVEGLALTKLTSTLAIIPLVALIPSPLRYVAGVLPPYWIGELLGLGNGYALPLELVVALAAIVHIVIVALLFRMFARRLG